MAAATAVIPWSASSTLMALSFPICWPLPRMGSYDKDSEAGPWPQELWAEVPPNSLLVVDPGPSLWPRC